MSYEVAIHTYGRKLIRRDGPAQGLLEWPMHQWGRITARLFGLANAIKLADAQATHATVQIWKTAEVVHDNGKPATVPDGWWPADAQYAAQCAPR